MVVMVRVLTVQEDDGCEADRSSSGNETSATNKEETVNTIII